MTTTYKLWENGAPFAVEGGEEPTLVYYPAEEKKGKGTVLICPGGGYRNKAEHEGRGYAEYLNAQGLDAFVLMYRTAPTYHFPCALLDARRAMRFIRANAEKFDINPEKIAIMGSSAGGHLAALTSTYRDALEGEGADELDSVDYLPSAQILCYPVITPSGHAGSYFNLLGSDKMDRLKRNVDPSIIADKKTPPAFIWHTAQDPVVTATNSYDYASMLYKMGVPVEMHIYPFGPHGLGLANRNHLPEQNNPHVQSWAGLLTRWLNLFGFIE